MPVPKGNSQLVDMRHERYSIEEQVKQFFNKTRKEKLELAKRSVQGSIGQQCAVTRGYAVYRLTSVVAQHRGRITCNEKASSIVSLRITNILAITTQGASDEHIRHVTAPPLVASLRSEKPPVEKVISRMLDNEW